MTNDIHKRSSRKSGVGLALSGGIKMKYKKAGDKKKTYKKQKKHGVDDQC